MRTRQGEPPESIAQWFRVDLDEVKRSHRVREVAPTRPRSRVSFYFFDNNISPRIPEALRVLGQSAVHIADCAERGVARDDADVDSMPKVAKLGWFAVTVDNNIQRRREERLVREECELRVVYLPGTFGRKYLFFQQAVFVIRAWENIIEASKGARPGQCLRVQENHRVVEMG